MVIVIGFTLQTIGGQSVGGYRCTFLAQVYEIHIKKTIYLYWINNDNNSGICDSWIYTLVLDICCQHLGVNASWRVSVRPLCAGLGNVHFLTYIFVLDIYYQLFGRCMSVGYMYRYWVYSTKNWGFYQLQGVYAPFGRRVGKCTFSKIYICIK